MGKKSKKTACGGARPKAPATNSTAAVSSNEGGGGGGILASSSGGSKKNRCVLCCALLKDLSKAHACPGCSLLYCWRCEKKNFVECPNEDNCVRPIATCTKCRLGVTMERELVATGALGPNEKLTIAKHWAPTTRKVYEEIVDSRADLTDDSWPYGVCGAKACTSYNGRETFGEMLEMMECIHCASASANKLVSCCRCHKIRCRPCGKLSARFCANAIGVLMDETSETAEPSGSAIAAYIDCFKLHCPDKVALCLSCSRRFCFDCIDSSELERSAKHFWAIETGRSQYDESLSFKCTSCYWSAKPCTNPSCPNEVGIPTKRCGGCHLDRYCSVECQAAMYLDHVGKCKKIQAKRAAADK